MLLLLAICSLIQCGLAEGELATFYLDTRISGRALSSDTINTYQFRNDLPVKLIIHGWSENASRIHYLDMAQNLLKEMDCYVIRVDYSGPAGQNYLAAANSVRDVGKYVADYLLNLLQQFDIPLSSVHVIGHSLGSQVAGYLGRRVIEVTCEKLLRITGLDPAAPLFENNPNSMRLTRKDAQVVDLIHTDGGMLGYSQALGRVDFFVNGGSRTQPGCKPSGNSSVFMYIQSYMQEFYCSHHKSYHYFIASIEGDYIATKCNSWDDYRSGACDQNEKILFGERMPEYAIGSYYIDMYVSGN